MKRFKVILCLIISLLFLFSGCNITNNTKVEYKDVADGVALYRYKGNSVNKTFTIPDEYQGKKVVELLDFSVANSEYLKEITIGKNVKRISNRALVNCLKVERYIVAPGNKCFETDENGVLYTKGKTEVVSYPNARVKVEQDSSGKILSGGSITLPDSVKKIRSCAFYLCNNLYEINFNEGLEEIGEAAFLKCTSLQNFKLPNSVQVINKDAFSFCDSLTYIEVPKGVKKIGDYAFFSKATKVEKVVVRQEKGEVETGKDWLPSKNGLSSGGIKPVYKP